MVGIINIIGEIGVDVTLASVASQVERQREAMSWLINISSEGGSVSVGLDIYNYLNKLKGFKKTVGRSIVASMGTILFLVGDEREVLDDTRFFIHLPIAKSGGLKTANELMVDAVQLKEIENSLISIYKNTLSLDEEVLFILLKNETFLKPAELYAFGFTTKEDSLKISAKINFKSKKSKMKKTLLERVKALIGAKMLLLKTATEQDLVFPDLADGEEPTIGSIATLDGATAEGEVTLADGKVFVFETGALVEIKEADETDNSELEEKVEELTAIVTELVTAIEDVQAKLNIKAKIDNIGGSGSPDAKKRDRQGYERKSGLSGAINKLKNDKK